MGFSLMVISILLSYQGTSSEAVTSKVAIAFFVLVSNTPFQINYMLFFGSSLNAIPWCYAPEILPLKARAKGTSLAVMMNWVSTLGTQPLRQRLTPGLGIHNRNGYPNHDNQHQMEDLSCLHGLCKTTRPLPSRNPLTILNRILR
ncbi:hypothetical protein E4T47_05931 [Aureobasidium subglaciale]|nr:hypothetical protein E4T47_05931 [Aureobasidium subglaciale]